MNVAQLRVFYGVKNNTLLAKKIKRGRTTIWEWEKFGIPPRTQALFEVNSDGQLKADRVSLSATNQ
ncbi:MULTISPECIES: hypothetical protein [Acinetobacter]|uniref:hypothetical protein n=1 Tax=Acinetobacter TaxID=469 RepID=UPI0002AEA2CD|nr:MULTISPECIES: hypothetical protein [Acinetobacter]ELW77326.1 hypothetical protein ACINWC743_2807 [Acinetobacter sp. WC-743]MCU4599102.1 hypothetical protein [Acinetobacter bereziniae]